MCVNGLHMGRRGAAQSLLASTEYRVGGRRTDGEVKMQRSHSMLTTLQGLSVPHTKDCTTAHDHLQNTTMIYPVWCHPMDLSRREKERETEALFGCGNITFAARSSFEEGGTRRGVTTRRAIGPRSGLPPASADIGAVHDEDLLPFEELRPDECPRREAFRAANVIGVRCVRGGDVIKYVEFSNCLEYIRKQYHCKERLLTTIRNNLIRTHKYT